MTTPVDLVNRALSEMGTQSTIASLSETSPEAVQSALWYTTLRRQLLRTANWGFARRQVALTLLASLNTGSPAAPYPYLFKYAYPADCLKVRYLFLPPQLNNTDPTAPAVDVGPSGWCFNVAPSRQWRFLINEDVDPATGALTKTILSNVPGAVCAYTMDVDNCDRMDELFQGALTAALAYRLVIPLSGNAGMRADFKQSARDAILAAQAIDGNEAIPTTEHVVDWMAARGPSSPYGLGAAPFGDWGNWFSGNEAMNWGM